VEVLQDEAQDPRQPVLAVEAHPLAVGDQREEEVEQ
jgi:hypothetical protein